MSRTVVQTLISDLSREWGLPDLAMDENDFLCVQTNGVVINVDYFEDENVLAFYGTVADMPTENREPVLEAMLVGNFGWQETAGATLALDSTEQLALLTVTIPVNGLDLPVLLDCIQMFTDLAWHWSKKIDSLATGYQEPATAEMSADHAHTNPGEPAVPSTFI